MGDISLPSKSVSWVEVGGPRGGGATELRIEASRREKTD